MRTLLLFSLTLFISAPFLRANDPPVITSPVYADTTLPAGIIPPFIAFTATDDDGFDEFLTFSAMSTDPLVVTISAVPGGYELNLLDVGMATVSFSVDDGVNPAVSRSFNVTVTAPINQQPYITTPGILDKSREEGSAPFVVPFTAEDEDGFDEVLTYSSTVSSPGIASAAKVPGGFEVTPLAIGTVTITFTASDGVNPAVSEDFELVVTSAPVNMPPILLPADFPDLSVALGSPSFPVPFMGVDDDGFSDLVTRHAVSSDASVAIIYRQAGQYHVTALNGGVTEITVGVSDGVNPATEASFTLTVTGASANTPPVITPASVDNLTLYLGSSPRDIDFSVTDDDGFDDTVTTYATVSSLSGSAMVVGASFDGDGIRLIPLALGKAQVWLQASDGVNPQTSVNFTVTVLDPNLAAPWEQTAYVKASAPEAFDAFGSQVAFHNGTLVVSAPSESSSATGVDGDESDNSASGSGAVYVFRSINGVWEKEAYLKASNTDANDGFGGSVAIFGDTIVVGADKESSGTTMINGDATRNDEQWAGAAYVFHRDTDGNWSQQAYLKASNTDRSDGFGRSVAIYDDTIVVGAPSEDSAATGVGGDETDENAIFSGAAYVFDRIGTSWSQTAYLKASNTEQFDNFGVSVAIDRATIVVGAPAESSAGTGVNADQMDNSLSWAGAAYVFHKAATGWEQQAYLKASNTGDSDNFGSWVKVSGERIAVSSPNESSKAVGVNGDQSDNSALYSGAVYIFSRSDGMWSQDAYIKAPNTEQNDVLGAIDFDGKRLVAGASGEKGGAMVVNGDFHDNSLSRSGAAYVYDLIDGNWEFRAYLKAANAGDGDDFGVAVAVSGLAIVVGAFGEAGGISGPGAAGADNSAEYAGAAYVFSPSNPFEGRVPATLSAPVYDGNVIKLTWEGLPGEEFVLERSADLWDWTAVFTDLVGDGTPALLCVPLLGNNNSYFRIRRR